MSPMAEDDMYNYPLVAPDGGIACLIRVTRPRVVRFDPQSGARLQLGPQAVQGEDTLDLTRGEDGHFVLYYERPANALAMPMRWRCPPLNSRGNRVTSSGESPTWVSSSANSEVVISGETHSRNQDSLIIIA